MRTEYNFVDSRVNPYEKKLRRQITIRLNAETVDYFKLQSSQSGLPYQALINLYLTDCAQKAKKLELNWR